MFDCKVIRDQLIIQDKTVRKLRLKKGVLTADFKKVIRTWTDSSGQHQVEAKFVRLAEGKVILKTVAGREIRLQ